MEGMIPQLAAGFETLGPPLDEWARELMVVQRQRKITGRQLVMSLVFSWWRDPQATWDDLAANAGRWFGVKITPQALHERVGPPLWELLLRLAQHLVQETVCAAADVVPILNRFAAVLVHDATTISLVKDLAERFPGCGNQQGSSAALKLLAQWNVLTGSLTAMRLGHGRTSDSALGRELPDPPAGSLVLCDRGFFDLAALGRWQAAGAFFVLRPLTKLTLAPLAEPLRPVVAWLQAAPAQGRTLDEAVELSTARFPCRLIAVRCPPAVSARRRRKLRETARRKNRAVSAEQLVLCDWFVVLTNLPPDQLTVEEALVVYRVRWQIELLFKTYKSQSGLDRSRARTGWPRLAEFGAKWVARLLEHHLLAPTGGPFCGISWLRRIRELTTWVECLVRELDQPHRFGITLGALCQRLQTLPRQRRRKKYPSTRDLLDNPKKIRYCLT